MWGLYKDSLASHVDVLGIMQNPPRRLAQGGRTHMRLQPRALRSFCIYAAAPLGDTS